MEEFKKQSSCSPYNIHLRRETAKYNRERQRIQKEQGIISRNFKSNERKLRAAQRGVVSLLGQDVYMNCVVRWVTVALSPGLINYGLIQWTKLIRY
jgi:hypothetical protein